ncbi:MAG: methylamine utilization protein MauJ [Candidatus Sulfotelmatobacter sp.]
MAEKPTTPVVGQVPVSNFRGENSRITMVPIFPEGDPRNTSSPAGLPGKYKVTFILSRPRHVVVSETVHNWADAIPGDSHLAITRPAVVPANMPDAKAIKVRAWGAGGFHLEFIGYPNEKGYLGQLQSEPFEAGNFYDAEQKAYHPLFPILSNWSLHLDIPVFVVQSDAVELRTGAHSGRVFTAPAEARFSVKGKLVFKPGSEFPHYASLYREALNSNSTVYRFLCLFKIIEGIQARRGRIAAEAVNAGQKPRSLVERIPEDKSEFQKWLDAVYHVREWHELALIQVFPPEIRGKKFNAIIDSQLRPLRNEVAHAIMDSGELGMSADDLLKLERVDYWLPVTRTMVRRMLKNEFIDDFLSYLPDP